MKRRFYAVQFLNPLHNTTINNTIWKKQEMSNSVYKTDNKNTLTINETENIFYFIRYRESFHAVSSYTKAKQYLSLSPSIDGVLCLISENTNNFILVYLPRSVWNTSGMLSIFYAFLINNFFVRIFSFTFNQFLFMR